METAKNQMEVTVTRRGLAHRLAIALDASGREWSAHYGNGDPGKTYLIDGRGYTPGQAAELVGIPLVEA